MHAKRMARRQKREKAGSKLNLVSLMDIFTILVFFLLVNSSDVEVLQNNKSIKLPESVAEKKPENNLVIMVSKNDIVINGRLITTLEDAQKNIQENPDQGFEEIADLKKELTYLASRKPYASEDARIKGRDVTIMGDATIPYTVLKRVMTTCAASEYRNISLAVSQKHVEEGELAGAEAVNAEVGE